MEFVLVVNYVIWHTNFFATFLFCNTHNDKEFPFFLYIVLPNDVGITFAAIFQLISSCVFRSHRDSTILVSLLSFLFISSISFSTFVFFRKGLPSLSICAIDTWVYVSSGTYSAVASYAPAVISTLSDGLGGLYLPSSVHILPSLQVQYLLKFFPEHGKFC